MGKDFRIIDSHFEIHVTEVATPHPFDDSERFRLRMSAAVQPSEVVESAARHHECLTFPVANGIAEEAGIRVLWQLTAVGKNRSMWTIWRFIKDQRQARSLNDSGQVEEVMERNTH